MSILLSFLSWIAGSKAGRIAAVIVLTLVTVAILLLRAYSRGKTAAALADQAAALENLRKKVAVDDRVQKMSRAQRDAEFARWVRHD